MNDVRIHLPLLVFSAVLVFGLLSNIVVSCANGAQDFRTIAIVNISTGLSSLLAMVAMVTNFGLTGALLAASLLPLVTFLIALYLARKKNWWPRKPMSSAFSSSEFRSIASFVPVAIVNSVGPPILQLIIRGHVIADSGMNSVGLLQGVMRISDLYVGIAGSVLAMYFFPKFCEAQTSFEFSRQVRRSVFFIGSLGLLVGSAIYLLRDIVVVFVFTKQFLPMTELFGWQTVGGVLKIISWPLAFALLAKANALAYAAFEILTLVTWWLLAVYFIEQNGTVGATQAYAVTYAIYGVVALIGILRIRSRLSTSANA